MQSRYAQQLAGLIIGLAALIAAGSLRWWEGYERSPSHVHSAAVTQQQPPPGPNAQKSPEDDARAARQAAGALLLFRVGSPDPGQE